MTGRGEKTALAHLGHYREEMSPDCEYRRQLCVTVGITAKRRLLRKRHGLWGRLMSPVCRLDPCHRGQATVLYPQNTEMELGRDPWVIFRDLGY